ncbi:MAG: hypothetical protein ABF991_00350 [Liquorilactobacillus hordei]|uniref:hypothetical protein n=1 Tax=Liquorilactobacillus hordei TaxID=468911 RepID=UPI0039ED917C
MYELQHNNVNVLVKSEREWNLLMESLEGQNITWGGKYRPTEINNWNDFEENTVVTIKDNKLNYGRIENLAYPTLFYCKGLLLKVKE